MNNINMDKNLFREMDRLLGHIETSHKRKRFVDNITRIYEEYKHNTFYTKGIIYNSDDRIMSSTVVRSVLENTCKLVEDYYDTVIAFILDKYSTTIVFHLTDNQLYIKITANGVTNPKINKNAMEILAASLYERLAK